MCCDSTHNTRCATPDAFMHHKHNKHCNHLHNTHTDNRHINSQSKRPATAQISREITAESKHAETKHAEEHKNHPCRKACAPSCATTHERHHNSTSSNCRASEPMQGVTTRLTKPPPLAQQPTIQQLTNTAHPQSTTQLHATDELNQTTGLEPLCHPCRDHPLSKHICYPSRHKQNPPKTLLTSCLSSAKRCSTCSRDMLPSGKRSWCGGSTMPPFCLLLDSLPAPPCTTAAKTAEEQQYMYSRTTAKAQ